VRSVEVTLEVERGHDFFISVIHNGDEHVGNPAADEDLMLRTVARVEGDPHAYWFQTGDACEYITRSDKRYEAGKVPDWFTWEMLADVASAQNRHYHDIYGPIAKKCLASVEGNHEFSISQHNDRDVYADLWNGMGLPAKQQLGYQGYLRLRLVASDRVVWRPTFFLFHSSKAGATGSIVNYLHSLPAHHRDVDIFCIGHSHKRVATESIQSGMDRATGRIVEYPLAFSCTGSYIIGALDQQDGGYNERKGYAPEPRGPVEIRLYPERKQVVILK
jgi:hypothetical protein